MPAPLWAVFPFVFSTSLVANPEDFRFGLGFGLSVSLAGDMLVTGTGYARTAAGKDAGVAYIFTRSGADGWTPIRLTAPDAAAGDQFGDTVAVSADTVVVGAPSWYAGGAGAAHVFVRTGAAWTHQQKLLGYFR